MQQTQYHGKGASINWFNETRWLMSIARSTKKLVPFTGAVAVGAAWFIYPALTPEFKGNIGLGPKVESSE